MSEMATMRGRKRGKTPNRGLPFPSKIYEGVKVPESLDWRLYGTYTKSEMLYQSCICLAAIHFLPQLCPCRCCDPSEGPGHLRLLLELCHHRSSRGCSLPKGESIKRKVTSPVFSTVMATPSTDVQRGASSAHVLVHLLYSNLLLPPFLNVEEVIVVLTWKILAGKWVIQR